MTHDAEDRLAEMHRLLEADPTAMPWPERIEVAEELKIRLSRGEPPAWLLRLARLLAADEKWEVRAGVAHALAYLPEYEFVELAAKLTADGHSFVRRTAQRVLEQRSKERNRTTRSLRDVERIDKQFDEIERLHGTLAANRCRQIAQLLVQSVVASATHDINTTLVSLKTEMHSLLEHARDGEVDQVVQFGGRVLDGLGFAEQLLEDLKDYARAAPVEFRSEQLAGVLHDAARTARTAVEKRVPVDRIRCQVTVPDDLVVEMCRRDLLAALMNIVKNAYLSFPSETSAGQLEITATENQTHVTIAVRDTGAGMSAETLESVRAFIPGTTTMPGVGSGYGLPRAEKSVRDHGGTLTIDSQIKQGTTVTICLPLLQTER